MDNLGNEVTSSITSLDIHDISRSARTYGVSKYFIVHPSEIQRKFVERVVNHFVVGDGKNFNPDRGETLELVEVSKSLELGMKRITEMESKKPFLLTTTAKDHSTQISYDFLREKILKEPDPILLVFGTSWGLSKKIIDNSDFVLSPLRSVKNLKYNHLSVRSASGIILDKILGRN